MSAKAKSKLTPEQQKATMTRVLQKIKPYGFFVVCSLIVAAVSVAAQLYIPILCGSAIDMMLGKGAVDFAGVLRIVYEIIVVAVVAAFAQWLLSVCNNRITFAVSRDLRNAAMRKIQTLPLSYLDSHPSGDIVSRMVADVDTFADGLLMGFTQLFSGVLTILGTLLFMLQQNVPITLVVVCITPLSLVVASFLAKRSYKYFQSQSAVRGEQTALVNEMIEGQKVVQAFGHEAQSLEAFDEVNGRLQNVSLKAIFFSSMTNPATRFVNNIVYAGVGLVGAIYAVAGGITIGQLSIFLNYERGVIRGAIVRARARSAVVGTARGETGLMERLDGVLILGAERHMRRHHRVAVLRRLQPNAVAILVIGKAHGGRVRHFLDVTQRGQQLLVEIRVLCGVGNKQTNMINHDEPPCTISSLPLSCVRGRTLTFCLLTNI